MFVCLFNSNIQGYGVCMTYDNPLFIFLADVCAEIFADLFIFSFMIAINLGTVYIRIRRPSNVTDSALSFAIKSKQE